MKSKIFFAVFIILIMISSVIGFMFKGGEDSVKYNGYKFTNVEGNWVTKINNQQVFLSERPDLLEEISVPDLSINYLDSMGKIYLSLDPEDKLDSSLYFFGINILSVLKPSLVRACIHDSEDCFDVPLKSCNDATENIFVIMIERGEENNLYRNNCLSIKGNQEVILRYLDKLTLELLI